MKYALLLTTAIAMGALLFNTVNRSPAVPEEVRREFQQWKSEQNKFYGSASEEQYRLSVFFQNKLYIDTVNAAQTDYSLAVNKFADLTREEFLAKYTAGRMERIVDEETEFSQLDQNVELPRHVDWRTKGAVTHVKNQGQCGSCWAFSTTGSLEGLRKIEGHKLLSLSEQQLMDCSRAYGNEGCQGGLMSQAFKYVIATGIQTEKSYPYKMRNEKCHSNKRKFVFHIKSFTNIRKYDNMELQRAVVKQPVSIAVDANALQFYSGGIITRGCGQSLDHGVLAVGYGVSSSGVKYWIVKNSWGANWGMKGYFEVQRRTSHGPSQCGVSEMASYPRQGSV